MTEGLTREHSRFYDSGRVQFVGLVTAVILAVGLVGAGFTLRDFTRTVEGSEARWAADATSERIQWEAINANVLATDALTEQMGLAVSILSELRCMSRAETPVAERECTSQEAERRLRRLQAGN